MSDPGKPDPMSQRLASLSLAERARLFEKLRDKKRSEDAAGSPAVPALLPRDRTAGPPPLSFAQQRLWFLDRLAPGDAAYNIATPVSITGLLDPGRLRRSLASVIARHDSLRTTFRLAGSEPVQEIAAGSSACALPVVDLAALAGGRGEAEALRLRDEDAARPFDLAAGPLLRSALLRLGPERHLLLLNLHHIISDGRSNGVLVRELTSLYDLGAGASLPELPIQYADFAVWQRRWLAGEVLERQAALWRRRLAGMPPALDLPSDRPRPPVRSSRGAFRELALEPALVLRLKEVARRQEATLFTVLLAVYQALLCRWTGQDDLCVGVPVANRNRREVAGLIGFFVNTLVLRGDLSGAPGLGELLKRLKQVTLEAFEHQDLPFEKLVEVLRPQRDPSRSPLVQVLLTLQNTPGAVLAAGGLRLELIPPPGRAAKGDVSVSLSEGEDGRLGGALTYSTDLFDATTMQRFAAHFAALLDTAAADPQRSLADLSFLSAGEMAQLLREWNDTRGAADPLPLHLRFAAQAMATPQAVAVETATRSLTYRELSDRAGRLARRLVALGAGPEVVVAVQADRSPELILGALGVWMAGGVYLPLDPSHPAERRAWALADSGAAFLLAAGEEILPAFSGPVLRLHEEIGETEEVGDLPPWHGLDNLAYVFYTSGSTGWPKGVMVPHRGLANLSEQTSEQTALFAAGPGSRVLLFASPAFDASLLDLALALGSGATLCLVPGRELPGLAAILRERAITHLHLPPSALAALAEGGPPEGLACVILGGEICPAPLAARWGAGRRLFNDYGPTEATVFATVDELRQGRLTTGRPLAGVAAHLLDRGLHPVPLGVAGEVCLAGAGLARGYLGRPDLTAERFVPHPCAGPEERGARLYRTGDLARRLPDGCLDVLGRIDRQVKIRGIRVELGEIEAALRRHPGVREAAVLTRSVGDGGGDGLSLVAWVSPAGAVEPGELRAFLRESLPAPVVPPAVFALDRLPLTANGKVDLDALARLEPASGGVSGGVVRSEEAPPRNELEQAVAAAWCEVLGLPSVSRTESFFDLGGHSLLLARVQSRLAETLRREVPLLKLFEHPTVESLAAWLDGTDGKVRPDPDHQRRARQQRQGLELQRRRSAEKGAPR
ncbi:MAG TPA: amino acid adenylation domain-containing protein [Thermoanaerobaculia bacterium]|nr:amino acid adenylation domain-containing protein [Thermoanaerobaculia bacterium]